MFRVVTMWFLIASCGVAEDLTVWSIEPQELVASQSLRAALL